MARIPDGNHGGTTPKLNPIPPSDRNGQADIVTRNVFPNCISVRMWFLVRRPARASGHFRCAPGALSSYIAGALQRTRKDAARACGHEFGAAAQRAAGIYPELCGVVARMRRARRARARSQMARAWGRTGMRAAAVFASARAALRSNLLATCFWRPARRPLHCPASPRAGDGHPSGE